MVRAVTPIPFVRARFFDRCGKPLAGGKVYTYEANTTTPKVTYKDPYGLTPNTNPIILDAAGEADIYLDGTYRIRITDRNDVLVNDAAKIGSWFSDNLQDTLDNISGAMDEALKPMLQNLDDAINTAAAAGAGANGWTTDLVVENGLTQKQINAAQKSKNAETVSVKDFGAKGDGVTDDTMAIQDAVEYAINNKKNLYFPTASYAISKTILIPRLYDPSFKKNYNLTIDGNNSNFVMLNDVTLFESGYYDNGVLKSNLGTPLVTYNTFGLVLENFYITSKDGAWLLSPALKIQDWHQGCKIQRISSSVNATLLHSYDNFYCQFYMMSGSSSAGKTGERFIFEKEHNLCKFDTLVAVDAEIGYWFKGALTACQITNLSFEGHTNSLVFDSYVYDVTIENCYAEIVSDSVITFNSYALSVYINNNYVNYVEHEDEMWFINFTKQLPGNGVVITETNYFSIADRLFKNATPDDWSMAGVKVVKPRINGNINALLVDNTKYSKFLNYQQTVHLGGAISNVVNQYVVGNYAGKYSDGYNSPNGFVWVNLNGKNIQLNTKITPSGTQRIYVNIVVSTATTSIFIRGEFIGKWGGTASFWQYKDDGTFGKTTILSVSTDANGFISITGVNEAAGNIVSVFGEVRLI